MKIQRDRLSENTKGTVPFVCFMILLLMLPVQVFSSTLGNVYSYIDSDGTEKVVNASDVTLITSTNMPTTLTDGWYLVRGTVEYSGQVTISGTVHLILEDGCSVTATNYAVNQDNTFNIYGQKQNSGTLITGTPGANKAGIGSSGYNGCGVITINGGRITATGGLWAPAIGGVTYGNTITINGGIVNATGGRIAAAIGGGQDVAGTVIINGGQVTATEDRLGTGIGNFSSTSYGTKPTIILGWTNAETDFILATGYSGKVTFAEGKVFVLETSGEFATASNINGQKIVPFTAGHVVSFNSLGGSTVPMQIVAENGTATEPTPPTRTGYTFGGWYTDADCTDGNEYNFSAIVTQNLTLYAKWTLTPYTITAPASIDVTVDGNAVTTATMGQQVTLAPKDGYTLTSSITVTDANSQTVALTDNGNNSYTFTMPASNVSVVAMAGIIEPGWQFVGTYKTQNFTAIDMMYYGFVGTAGTGMEVGTFVQVGGYVRVKPMRAYLVAPGGTPKSAPGSRAGENVPSTLKVRLIGTNGETTGILSSDFTDYTDKADAWYSLDGRKLQGEPAQKGLYITHGKKVVIK